MKKLILVRHAKSNWDTIQKDIDRPLEYRGIQAAHKVSKQLLEYLPKTYMVFSSVAKRASDTATIFAQNLNYPLDNINFTDSLYTFEVLDLEQFIKSLHHSYDTCVVFGHNNAIIDFVNKYILKPIEKIPTTAVVVIDFEVQKWHEISKGTLIKTIFPKELIIQK
jgi:phosphohistidine phosphatase